MVEYYQGTLLPTCRPVVSDCAQGENGARRLVQQCWLKQQLRFRLSLAVVQEISACGATSTSGDVASQFQPKANWSKHDYTTAREHVSSEDTI